MSGKTAVASPTIARFYLAAEGSMNIGEIPAGYTISLIEVRNVKQQGEEPSFDDFCHDFRQ